MTYIYFFKPNFLPIIELLIEALYSLLVTHLCLKYPEVPSQVCKGKDMHRRTASFKDTSVSDWPLAGCFIFIHFGDFIQNGFGTNKQFPKDLQINQ